MSDREALLALAAPEPEPFDQVRLKREDWEAWDGWNKLRIEALAHAASLLP